MISSEYYNLINNIKTYRKNNNLTQEQLAEKANLSVSYIKQIEGEKSFKNLTFKTLFKIAKALNINVNELFLENSNKIGV
ncbi:MAG: helix-turn-helix transcriptional regulator [Bacilli bacterium]